MTYFWIGPDGVTRLGEPLNETITLDLLPDAKLIHCLNCDASLAACGDYRRITHDENGSHTAHVA